MIECHFLDACNWSAVFNNVTTYENESWFKQGIWTVRKLR